MPLETANFISQLIISNPAEGDPVQQGSDHLRLIKNSVQQSFPNINGAVTATPKNLNDDLVPVGFIGIWSGAINALPPTWALCDGGSYAKADGSGIITTPNLKDMFIVGAGNTYAVGATGGAASNTPTIGGTAITQAQLPSCNFGASATASTSLNLAAHLPQTTLNGPDSILGTSGGGVEFLANTGGTNNLPPWFIPQTEIVWDVASASTSVNVTVSSNGSGATHAHTCSAVPTIPPYYALAFIMKL